MAHNLTETNGVVEFVSGRNKVAWHGLGQVVNGLMTSKEAIVQSHLDWEVEGVPACMETPNGLQFIDNHTVIRRKDTLKAFAVMSDSYRFIQNSEAFEFADSIVQEEGAFYDTAGSIDGGAKVFMTMLLPNKLMVNGNSNDTIEKYLLLTNSHNGTSALMAMITPVRVVCQNTLNAALRNNTNMFKVRHTKNFMDKAREGARVLGLANSYYDDLQYVINQLDKEEISKSYVEQFIATIVPSDDSDKIAKQTATKRDIITDLYYNGTGNNGRTKWDLYNAITEYVDHKSRGRETTVSKYRSDADANISDEQRFKRAMFGQGSRLKQEAFDLLLN